MRVFMFFFFKQKTAYEMRISDWSSDVCSSDLALGIEESDLVELALRPTDPRYAGSLLCRRQSGSAGRSRGRSGVRHFGLCAGDLLPGLDHGQVAQRDRLRLFSACMRSARAAVVNDRARDRNADERGGVVGSRPTTFGGPSR